MSVLKRDIVIVVGTALEKKLGAGARKEYESYIEKTNCVTDSDKRIVTSTFLTNSLFTARGVCEKPVYYLLPLLNHAEPRNLWLNNIKNKIIPRLKSIV